VTPLQLLTLEGFRQKSRRQHRGHYCRLEKQPLSAASSASAFATGQQGAKLLARHFGTMEALARRPRKASRRGAWIGHRIGEAVVGFFKDHP